MIVAASRVEEWGDSSARCRTIGFRPTLPPAQVLEEYVPNKREASNAPNPPLTLFCV